MSSDARTPKRSGDEAAEIARLIEELQAAGKPPVTARAAISSPVPLSPWQPVTSTSEKVRTRSNRFSRVRRLVSRFQPGVASGPMGPAAVWGCVTLGLLLGVSMLFWPYARGCGTGLFCYLGAVGMVHIAGVWGAWHAWDSRVGIAHVVALVIVLWGVSLTAQEILPRVGYSRTVASWQCSVSASPRG